MRFRCLAGGLERSQQRMLEELLGLSRCENRTLSPKWSDILTDVNGKIKDIDKHNRKDHSGE